ncbi:MAG TPA: UbiA-like polyprenyltransferase [Spirochaetota bacterium]|nr:UbiA-like polyprenyltransferase [Spirochaetota bacterium]HQO04210.1 UbiA-like polyprenyltransferase [Spirochaetota bacterium]HQP49246.1 UbiA-like polyprenyltransferase [Spirochaetota bacterium]
MDFKKTATLIMVEQTLFALPFAYLGLLFAGGGTVVQWLWVTVALVAGRTAGMSFNRVIDAAIDAKNPRTRDRAVPAGEVSRRDVWILAVVSCCIMMGASYMLNELCFYFSFIAVLLLFTYSYFKRFTAASHLYLGVVEAAAPVGGYIAVTGSFSSLGGIDVLPFLLGIAIMCWIGGLDIIYSFLDEEFDSREGLFSIPSKYGREKARIISSALYVAAFAALVLAGIMTRRGIAYWVSLMCVGLIFFQQQRLGRREDIEAAVRELFQMNAFVSPVLFAGMFIDVFFRIM